MERALAFRLDQMHGRVDAMTDQELQALLQAAVDARIACWDAELAVEHAVDKELGWLGDFLAGFAACDTAISAEHVAQFKTEAGL